MRDPFTETEAYQPCGCRSGAISLKPSFARRIHISNTAVTATGRPWNPLTDLLTTAGKWTTDTPKGGEVEPLARFDPEENGNYARYR